MADIGTTITEIDFEPMPVEVPATTEEPLSVPQEPVSR